MADPLWRVGRKLGRTVYLDGECVGMLDDARLARVVIEGLALLDELGDGEGADDWRARVLVWRLRLRALRVEALRGRSPRVPRPLARATRRAPRLAGR